MKKTTQIPYNGKWINPKHLRAFVYKLNKLQQTGFDQLLCENHREYIDALNKGWFHSKEDAKAAHSLDDDNAMEDDSEISDDGSEDIETVQDKLASDNSMLSTLLGGKKKRSFKSDKE